MNHPCFEWLLVTGFAGKARPLRGNVRIWKGAVVLLKIYYVRADERALDV